MKNKGISPVIATVLLIAIVVVLALIIFLWAKGWIQESVTKQGQPSDQACDEINLDVQYSDPDLQVINQGTIPVYKLEIIKKSGGSSDTEEWTKGLPVGKSETIEGVGSYDSIEVTPVILGETSDGKKSLYTCKKSFAAQ